MQPSTMHMIITSLLFLLLSFPAVFSAFDYFQLVLQWPNSVCSMMNTPACASATPPGDFKIHGLWPQLNGGQSQLDCDPSSKSLTDDMLEDLKGDLLTEWPNLYAKNWEQNKGFWKHEWIKHGTCSESDFPAKDYLGKAIALRKSIDVLHALSSNGIVPADSKKLYNPRDIRLAIQRSTKFRPDIQCMKGKGNLWYLVQVYFCVDKDGVQFKSCSGDLRGCYSGGAYVSVTFPTETHKLIPLKNNITG